MAVSTIDGTIDAVDLKRTRAGLSIYNSIRFTLADGSSRTVNKYVVAEEVGEGLQPGTRGRFYLFTALDIKGIHGFRAASGVSRYKYPGSNNARVFLIVALINLAILIVYPLVVGGVPLLAAGLTVFGAIGFVLMRKGESDAKAQFASDGGYATPAAATLQAG